MATIFAICLVFVIFLFASDYLCTKAFRRMVEDRDDTIKRLQRHIDNLTRRWPEKEIVQELLKHKSVLPILIGIHPSLDEKIHDHLK
jgi:F0F1-type ATP synthase membrane subunit b/b'